MLGADGGFLCALPYWVGEQKPARSAANVRDTPRTPAERRGPTPAFTPLVQAGVAPV